MVCDICKTRNPSGFCISCQKMLCEECSKLCEECGKMVCPDCAVTTRDGRVLCPNCVEELKAKRAKAKAKAAAGQEEAEGEEEIFPVPEAVPRVRIRPWVASLSLAALGVFLSLLFYALGGAVHISVFIVAVLGFAWGLVGVIGRYEQKGQALAGVVLNLAPFLLAAVLGLEVPWIEREREVETRQIEQMTEEEKAQMRAQQRQEMLRQIRQMQQQPPAE
jgi:hypothetical protein